MFRNSKIKIQGFHEKHKDSKRYHLLLWLFNAVFLIAKIVLKVAVFLFSFLIMRRAASFDVATDSAFVQDDRTSDDIWKLTSGNDYYDKKPPDSFS